MGIHPGFASFDRQSWHLDETRRTLWVWAEPVILDRTADHYARVLGQAAADVMALKHCRVWYHAVFAQSDAASAASRDLRRAAECLGVNDVSSEAVNDVILEELVDIVTSRYLSSRNATKAFSLALMTASSCLGALRAAA